MASDEVLIQTAISSWEQVIKRVGTLCLSCSEEQLLVEVAPGKNRNDGRRRQVSIGMTSGGSMIVNERILGGEF